MDVIPTDLTVFVARKYTTVNLPVLMFVGINVDVFETKPCSRGLIFTISSGLVDYLGTWIMFAGIYFYNSKVVMKIAK